MAEKGISRNRHALAPCALMTRSLDRWILSRDLITDNVTNTADKQFHNNHCVDGPCTDRRSQGHG
jgi:hypothetical protein